MDQQPKLIRGGIHTDERGSLSFINTFDFERVQRFYQIAHPTTDIIRAWQAHQIECKWFFVSSGAFKIILIKIDDWDQPSEDLNPLEFILDDKHPSILYIPGGYANGFQALVPHSKLMVFSSLTIEESKGDDFRFGKDQWYKW
jgi:dTDP-4-dehydrorhamnose 3,5-epimerase